MFALLEMLRSQEVLAIEGVTWGASIRRIHSEINWLTLRFTVEVNQRKLTYLQLTCVNKVQIRDQKNDVEKTNAKRKLAWLESSLNGRQRQGGTSGAPAHRNELTRRVRFEVAQFAVQPGGFSAISRWLSEAIPPEKD